MRWFKRDAVTLGLGMDLSQTETPETSPVPTPGLQPAASGRYGPGIRVCQGASSHPIATLGRWRYSYKVIWILSIVEDIQAQS